MTHSQDALFPIRTVSELTGVNPITLRAWERRYGLIQPQRTPKGHRLYCMQDVDFIKNVLDVLKQGVSIGRVRHFMGTSREPINTAMIQDNAEPIVDTDADSSDVWMLYQQKIQQAISEFDASLLDRIYHEMVSQYPLNLVAQHALLPLLNDLSNKRFALVSTAGEYHFYQQFLRSRISANYLKENNDVDKRKPAQLDHTEHLLMAALDDHDGEIHLLLLGADLVVHGFHTIFLGKNVPVEALPLAVDRSKATGLVLYHSDIEKLDLNHLKALVSTMTIPVFFQGNVSDSLKEELAKIDVISLNNDMSKAAESMGKILQDK